MNLHIRVITSDDLVSVPSVSGKNSLSLYPNPSDGNFFIDFNNNTETATSIYIFDITGKQVYGSQSKISGFENINLSKLNKGIYFINIQQGSEIYNHKIIIE